MSVVTSNLYDKRSSKKNFMAFMETVWRYHSKVYITKFTSRFISIVQIICILLGKKKRIVIPSDSIFQYRKVYSILSKRDVHRHGSKIGTPGNRALRFTTHGCMSYSFIFRTFAIDNLSDVNMRTFFTLILFRTISLSSIYSCKGSKNFVCPACKIKITCGTIFFL